MKLKTILTATVLATVTAVLPATTASAAPRGEIIGYQYTGKLSLSGSPGTCLTATAADNVVTAECGSGPEGSNQVWYMYYTIRYTGVTGKFHGSISLILEHKSQYLSIKLGTTRAIVFDTAVLVSFEKLTKNHWLIQTLAGTALTGKPVSQSITGKSEEFQANWLKYKTRGTIQTWVPYGGTWEPIGELT